MSGYLQRLVQTAAKPAATIHPFADSIFATTHEDGQRAVEPEESIVGESKAAPVASSVPQSGIESDFPRSTTRTAEYRPIAPIYSEAPAEPPRDRDDMPPSRTQSSLPLPRHAEDAPEAEFESVRPRAGLTLERDFHPLIPKHLVVAEARIETPPSRGNRHDTRAIGGAVAIQREADDIQIHIGRIEVTAVHPPVSRPKAPDRSPSLDAYLNRRAR